MVGSITPKIKQPVRLIDVPKVSVLVKQELDLNLLASSAMLEPLVPHSLIHYPRFRCKYFL